MGKIKTTEYAWVLGNVRTIKRMGNDVYRQFLRRAKDLRRHAHDNGAFVLLMADRRTGTDFDWSVVRDTGIRGSYGPMFERAGLVGGLIYHKHSNEFGVHT